MRPLPRTFYARDTLAVAKELLGCELVVTRGRQICAGTIVETEAYIGEEDPACHAHRGQTNRNRVMYGVPGISYVYFTYGNHWMLNFVTEREHFPAAVLIRAVAPTDGIELMRRRRQVERDTDLTSGPGKLTAAFGINGDDSGLPLSGPRLTVVRGNGTTSLARILTSGRIGVNEGHERPWRFYLEGNPYVSKYRNGSKAHLQRRLSGSRAAA